MFQFIPASCDVPFCMFLGEIRCFLFQFFWQQKIGRFQDATNWVVDGVSFQVAQQNKKNSKTQNWVWNLKRDVELKKKARQQKKTLGQVADCWQRHRSRSSNHWLSANSRRLPTPKKVRPKRWCCNCNSPTTRTSWVPGGFLFDKKLLSRHFFFPKRMETHRKTKKIPVSHCKDGKENKSDATWCN